MAEEDFIPLLAPSEAGTSTPAPPKKMRKNEHRVNTTLFISSLPYTATTTDLLTHFSFLGPVRHGFVATDKASGKSKGVGYVTYSLREDAEQAVAELDNKEFGGEGRKIRVAWADHKPSTRERAARPAPDPSKIIQPGKASSAAGGAGAGAGGDDDPNAIRTLVLSELPEVDKGTLWKRVRKVNDAIQLVYPVEGQDKMAHLIFPSHGDALKGLPKLQGHTYKGAVISAVLKKRMDKMDASGKAASHAGRLIVRNLPWDTREDDLKSTFLPYGPLREILIPTVPSKLPSRNGKPAPPRLRGFAFVWFVSKSDAEKAIAGVNGKPISRAQGKTWKSAVAAKGDGERVVAVDWALSKEKWQEAQGEDGDGDVKMEGDEKPDVKEEEEDSEESGDEEDSVDESEESEDEDEDGSSGEDDAEEDGEEASADADEDEDEEPTKPTLPTVDVGSTLFIRNLPFEVTEQELNTLFRTFGPLRYARITIDKSTGRSRGTGFVCFWKTEHADAAIAEAERVQAEGGAAAFGEVGATGANAIGPGATASKNPFALPSLLTVDPSSSLASKLVIQGRVLDVTRAVTREQAGVMKEDGERARQAGDKRNTYLMREGVVFPNSPAASSLPAAEIERRQESFNSRRTLLRSNPSLYISKTRLSIRQLPLFVTDRGLKRLAIHAVRAFDTEVASQDREGLSRVEETDTTLSPALQARADAAGPDAGTGPSKSKPKGKKPFFKNERETPVMQSKVVRQSEKLDPLTNLGKSKGYGFLEMRSHKEALKVLRWANNNPDVGPLVWTWWREEMQDLLKRASDELKARRQAQEGGKGEEETETEEQKKKRKEKEEKGGKVKESMEELESRVRKLEERCKEGDEYSGGGMRGGKTLLIEFSIENVQVVRRRVGKISEARQESAHSRSYQDRNGRSGRDDQREPHERSSASQSLYAAGQKRKAAEDTDDEDAAPARGGQKGGRPDMRDHRPHQSRDGQVQDRRGGRDGRDRRDGKDGKDGGRPKRGKFGKGANGDSAPASGAAQEKPREKRGIEKMGDHLGSLIGRKRKMRRGGK